MSNYAEREQTRADIARVFESGPTLADGESMIIYAFRNGRVAGVRGCPPSLQSAAAVIDHCRRFKDRWLESEFYLDELPAGASEVVETQLIIRPRYLGLKAKTHVFAKREKSEPSTVFIAALPYEHYRQLWKDVEAAWQKRLTDTKKRVKEMKPAASRRVTWATLPAELQRRVVAPISDDDCWYLQDPDARAKHALRLQQYHEASEAYLDGSRNGPRPQKPSAPYRAFYARTKGPILPGVLLRHKCDNRLCMNPNHLIPGTHKENARDRKRWILLAHARARAIRRFFGSAP